MARPSIREERVQVRNLKPGMRIRNPYTGNVYGVIERIEPCRNPLLRDERYDIYFSATNVMHGEEAEFEYDTTDALLADREMGATAAKFQIETIDAGTGKWSTDSIGPNNEFDTIEAAELAIADFRTWRDIDWARAEYRVTEVSAEVSA